MDTADLLVTGAVTSRFIKFATASSSLSCSFRSHLIQIRIFSLESLVAFVLFLAALEEYPSPPLDLVWSHLENDFHVTVLQIVKCSQSWLSKYLLVREKESNN